MPKLIPIKPIKLVKIVTGLGFRRRDAEGSHVFFKHGDGRTTVIPIHCREISKGLLRKILNNIKLTVDDFDKLRK